MCVNESEKALEIKKYHWFYSTERGRWVTSLLVSGMILVIVFLLIHPVFMTIDDARLKYVYAGYSTGVPEATYQFCYYPLGLILSILYTLFPAFHWYAFYQFALIGFSNAIIGKTIYKIFYKKELPFFKAIVYHVLLYLTIALISTIVMHFEITAAMIGTAGVSILLGIDFNEDKKIVKIIDLAISVFCITACYVIMFNAFYSACCYLLVAFVVLFFTAIKQKSIKKIIVPLAAYLLSLVLCVVGTNLLDGYMKGAEGWQDYLSYNKYRVSFWDYPHIDYQDNPELFEEMGWTEEFYTMTQHMYFMDERFNEENLSQFTQRFSLFSFGTLDEMIANVQETFQDLFEDERLVPLQIGVAAVFFLAIFGMIFSKRKWKAYYPQMIGILCCLFGTIILVMFLACRGRLPLRAWLACSIPCITVVAILLIKTFDSSGDVQTTSKKIKAILGVLVMTLWASGMIWSYDKVINVDWEGRHYANRRTMQMELYVLDHPENVYVYALSGAQNYSVFFSYPDLNRRPTNAIVWGSSYLFTPTYEKQLALNGKTQLLTENLFDENVFFISGDDSVELIRVELFKNMLIREYGGVQFVPVDYISVDGAERFTVYKIMKE